MTLKEFFTLNPYNAIGFSGGVDSAYLLYAASEYAKNVTAYYVKTAFQPQFELDDAVRFAADINVRLKIIELDIMSCTDIVSNPQNRCYYCKKMIFSAIKKQAEADGFSVILDGTNASDDITCRPGVKALSELSVRSPLRECGITKDTVRRFARQAGLDVWNKPSYSCLATRIPHGSEITPVLLQSTEKAENELFRLGFSDFRIRFFNGAAQIQLRTSELEKAVKMRGEIIKKLKPFYEIILLDLGGR